MLSLTCVSWGGAFVCAPFWSVTVWNPLAKRRFNWSDVDAIRNPQVITGRVDQQSRGDIARTDGHAAKDTFEINARHIDERFAGQVDHTY